MNHLISDFLIHGAIEGVNMKHNFDSNGIDFTSLWWGGKFACQSPKEQHWLHCPAEFTWLR